MPINGANKGKIGERELAALLTVWADEIGLAVELARNLEQVRGGGHDLTGLECYGMAVEVKRVESLAVDTWWRQAVRQAEKAGGLVPVLAWRQNRRPWRFRVRAFVWPAHKPLDIDLSAEAFKEWYQAQMLAGEKQVCAKGRA